MAANERTNVKLYPTAIASDLLFYVQVSATMPKNKGVAYGASYRTCLPSAVEDFPNHQLVFISPASSRSSDTAELQNWYFAADRASEDTYNWQITPENELVRAYLVRRSKFFGRSADEAAAVDPLVPDEFTRPAVPTADAEFAKYKFADDTVIEAPEELKSLYIVVKRRFVEKVRQRKSKGVPNLTPQKFRGRITTVDTTTQHPLTSDQDDIPIPVDPNSGNNESSIVHEKVNDYSYQKTITTEAIADGSPLVGVVLTSQGQIASTYEYLVADGTTFSASALVVDGKVDPLGNGKSVETLVTVGEVFSEQRLSVQRVDLLPARFRVALPERTESLVEAATGDSAALTLSTGQLSKTEDRITVHKKRITIVSRDASQAVTLTTKQNYVDGAQATLEEKYLPDTPTAPAPETGLLIIKAESVELGDGSCTTETLKVDSWPELTGSRWDELLNIQIATTEQYVAPGTSTSESNTSLKPINEHRSLRTHEDIPTAALNAYYNTFPKSVNVPLPDELVSAEIAWTESNDTGDYESNWVGTATGVSWSLNGSEDGTCHSSVTLIPELILDIKQAWGRNTPAVAHVFFLPMPVTEAAILSKVGAAKWPVFRPVSHVVALQGQKVSVQVRVAASASKSESPDGTMEETTTGKGGSADFQTVKNTVVIPPTIHGAINLGAASRTDTATANANIGWFGANFPSVVVVGNKSITATGKVTPNSLSATTPSEIPTSGIYLYDSDVEPYKWGYAKVYAITIDAANFA